MIDCARALDGVPTVTRTEDGFTSMGQPMEPYPDVVDVRQRATGLMVNVRLATPYGRGHTRSLALLLCMVLAACSTHPATAPTLERQKTIQEEQLISLKEQQEKLLSDVKAELKRLRQAGFRDEQEKNKYEELENGLRVVESRIGEETRNHYWKEGRSAEPFLSYGARLFQRVEANSVGRPPLSKGKAVYGTADLLFAVRADGTLEEVEVIDASNEEIGWHAAILLRESGPFEKFSARMSRQVDRIVFARRFTFVRGARP